VITNLENIFLHTLHVLYTDLSFSHVSSPNLSMTSDFRQVLIKPYCETNTPLIESCWNTVPHVVY